VSPRSREAARALLHTTPLLTGDLESVGTHRATRGSTRYVRYQGLLTLPQETYTISDDSIQGTAQISRRRSHHAGKALRPGCHSDLIVAICYGQVPRQLPQPYLAAQTLSSYLKSTAATRAGRLRTNNTSNWPLSSSPTPFHPSFPSLAQGRGADSIRVTRLEFSHPGSGLRGHSAARQVEENAPCLAGPT